MHDFTVLVLPDAFASSVASTLDLLAAASVVAPRLNLPLPRWRVVSPRAGNVRLGNGLVLKAGSLPRERTTDRSTWVIPGLGTESVASLEDRLAQDDARRASAAVAGHVAARGHAAASCASVFLLHGAGVLAGRRATTSWWLAPRLQQLEPTCTVAADQMVCVDGPITTAGAAFAHTDLMLHLLQSRFGTAMADMLRRLMVIDARQAQAPYVIPAMRAGGDALLAQLTARIESSLPNPPSVAALAREFAMSERTLARRVRAAGALTPLALVQSVRLNRARSLIETSHLSVEQVAMAVGYEDATALRRMMRRWAGATPRQFRSRRGLA
jgi:transcriptional regulator GlxA family with amidase domain